MHCQFGFYDAIQLLQFLAEPYDLFCGIQHYGMQKM